MPPPPPQTKTTATSGPEAQLRHHIIPMRSFRYEGAGALFKGWIPAWLRLGPLFVISWPLMEFMRKDVFGLQYF